MNHDYKQKDWLERYYVQSQHSLKIAASIAKCHPSTIRHWLNKHGIPIRTSMESKQIEARTKQKLKNVYERLCNRVGDFALSFELLCRDLRLGIWAVLDANGLKEAWHLTDILVGDLTAFPLQNILRALISQTRKISSDEEQVLNAVFKRIASISEARNSILHSAWYIDFKSRKDLLTDVYTKYRPGYAKTGAKPTPTKHSINEIERSSSECKALCEFVSCVKSCIYTNRPFTDYLHIVNNEVKFIDPTKKSAY